MSTNPFIPTDCPFEILGYMEEFIDCTTRKGLGYRRIDEPSRPCGSPGMKIVDLTEDIRLTKGLKVVTVKASVDRPRMVLTMILIICGRTKKISA